MMQHSFFVLGPGGYNDILGFYPRIGLLKCYRVGNMKSFKTVSVMIHPALYFYPYWNPPKPACTPIVS